MPDHPRLHHFKSKFNKKILSSNNCHHIFLLTFEAFFVIIIEVLCFYE